MKIFQYMIFAIPNHKCLISKIHQTQFNDWLEVAIEINQLHCDDNLKNCMI